MTLMLATLHCLVAATAFLRATSIPTKTWHSSRKTLNAHNLCLNQANKCKNSILFQLPSTNQLSTPPGARGAKPMPRSRPWLCGPRSSTSGAGTCPPALPWPRCLVKKNIAMWVWVKVPPGIGPQVLVFGSLYQGNPFRIRVFDP